MLILFLSTCFALAGELIIDAEIPVEIALDGMPMAQVFHQGQVTLQTQPGQRKVTLVINGNPTPVLVDVPETGAARVTVGRTGITTSSVEADAVTDTAEVDLRLVGDEGLRVTVGAVRYRMDPGDRQAMELARGKHPMELRSCNGQVVYAAGMIDVAGTGPVVLQLSAGRAPEVVGTTARWRPDER